MIISLIGYMGSGKSTVGKIIAQKMTYEFIDLDIEIEKNCGKSIEQIFQEKGELGFRKLEKETLELILETKTNLVLSLGGGTPVYYDNMDLILNKSIVFYLRFTPLSLSNRLKDGRKKRPLIAHLEEDELVEFIAKHLFERSFFYEKATQTIDVKEANAIELAEEIIRRLV